MELLYNLGRLLRAVFILTALASYLLFLFGEQIITIRPRKEAT